MSEGVQLSEKNICHNLYKQCNVYNSKLNQKYFQVTLNWMVISNNRSWTKVSQPHKYSADPAARPRLQYRKPQQRGLYSLCYLSQVVNIIEILDIIDVVWHNWYMSGTTAIYKWFQSHITCWNNHHDIIDIIAIMKITDWITYNEILFDIMAIIHAKNHDT